MQARIITKNKLRLLVFLLYLFFSFSWERRNGCFTGHQNRSSMHELKGKTFGSGCFLLWSSSLKEKFRKRWNRTICNQNTFQMNIPYSYNALKRVIISKLMNGVKLGEFQWEIFLLKCAGPHYFRLHLT